MSVSVRRRLQLLGCACLFLSDVGKHRIRDSRSRRPLTVSAPSLILAVAARSVFGLELAPGCKK